MRLANWVMAAVALATLAALGGCKGKGDGAGGGKGSVTVNQGSPKEVVASLKKAAEAKDFDAMISLYDPPVQKTLKATMDPLIEWQSNMESLTKTVESKFGKDAAAKLRAKEDESPTGKMGKESKIDLDKIQIKTDGDKATVTVPEDTEPLDLKKVSGKWYIVIPEAKVKEMDQGAAMAKDMFGKWAKAIQDVEKRVKDGKITKDKFDEEYQKAMMGGMGLDLGPSSGGGN